MENRKEISIEKRYLVFSYISLIFVIIIAIDNVIFLILLFAEISLISFAGVLKNFILTCLMILLAIIGIILGAISHKKTKTRLALPSLLLNCLLLLVQIWGLISAIGSFNLVCSFLFMI